MKLFDQVEQEQYIRLAIAQAELSIIRGSNPFGAVMVSEAGKILAAAHNTVTPESDILQHAELNLLRIANKLTGRQKFANCAVFINAASCAMCASALIQAGVRRFYFGAPFESHTNPAVSYEQLATFCHEPLEITKDLLADECLAQIQRGREKLSLDGLGK